MTGGLEKSFKSREYFLLSAITLVAFGTRLVTYRFEDLLVYDPFHHYAIAKYIMENNEFPFFWYLSRFPDGVFIFEPMGLYYIPVLFYKILGSAGMTFVQTFKVVTPIFGTLTLVPFYFLTRQIFNRRVAFFSVTILAFLPAFLYRTFAGFYRGDAFTLPFMVAGFYFLLRALDSNDKKVPLSILAGICFGLMSLVWGGYLYGFAVLTGFAVFYSILSFIQKGDLKTLIVAYLIAAGIGILILQYSIILQPHRRYIADLGYILLAAIIFILLLGVIKMKACDMNSRRRGFTVVSIGALSLIALWSFDPAMFSRLLTGYGGVVARTAFTERILELQPLTLSMVWQKYSIASFLFPLGFLYLCREFYKEKSKEKLFVLIWFLVSMYLLMNGIRYAFLASLPIAILSALFLYSLEEKILRKDIKVKKLPQIITIVLLLYVVFAGVTFAKMVSPAITKNWHDALVTLKGEEKGNVLVWWGRGSWVQGITGFPTVVDTVHGQHRGHSKEIAEFFFETNKSKGFEFLRKYHVDYVIVPADMMLQIPNMAYILNASGYEYVLYPYESTSSFRGMPVYIYAGGFYVQESEEGKVVLYQDPDRGFLLVKNVYYERNEKLVVNEYANVTSQILDGGVVVSKDYLLYIPPELVDTLINSLLILGGEGFEEYEIIFQNPEVTIYKPIYDYTRINEIKTDKLYYRAGEEVRIEIKMKSTESFKGRLKLKIKNPDKAIVFQEDYNVTEDSYLNLSFPLSQDAIPGIYKIKARVYDSYGRPIDHMHWAFKVN